MAEDTASQETPPVPAGTGQACCSTAPQAVGHRDPKRPLLPLASLGSGTAPLAVGTLPPLEPLA